MVEVILRPQLHTFDTCKEFTAAFMLGEGDLVLTNQCIFNPYFAQMGLTVHTLFLEEYGMGELTDTMVDAVMANTAKIAFRRVIAIGDGTVIDIAKLLAVTGDESVDELYEKAPKLTKHRELVTVPATCGTGSEVTNISILNRTRRGIKMGLVSETMYADSAVLIPELLQGLPFEVFAATSIDAMVHATESALSPQATSFTKLFSYKALEMIITGFQRIAEEGPEVRLLLLDDFLTAATYAGIAAGTAGCAVIHALGYPLSCKYYAVHAESSYAMFIGVLKNYIEIKSDGEIAVMNAFLSKLLGCPVRRVYHELENLLNQMLPKKSLREFGVSDSDIADFAQSVMTTQGRLMKNNFVSLDAARIRKIYSELY